MNAKKNDLMWLAGLLEGEGHFKPRNPSIRLNMTDREPLEKAKAIMGSLSSISCRPGNGLNCKDVYSFEVTGSSRVKEILVEIRSFMSPRRKAQIDKVIWECDRIEDDYLSGFQKAEIVRYVAKRRGLSGREISKRTGINSTTINRVISGKQNRMGAKGNGWEWR